MNGTLSKVIGYLVAMGWKMISGTQRDLTGSPWEADPEPNHPQWSMGPPDGLEKLPTGLFYASLPATCLWLTIRRGARGFSFFLIYWAFRQAYRENNHIGRGLAALLFHWPTPPEFSVSFTICKGDTKGMKSCPKKKPSSFRLWEAHDRSFFKNLFNLFLFIFDCIGSSLLHVGFSLVAVSGATLRCCAWASHCGGFSCCGARALERRLSSGGARA